MRQKFNTNVSSNSRSEIHRRWYCQLLVGRDSSIDMATRYGLDGQGSNSGAGEVFCTRPDQPWGPLSILYNGYRVPFPGVKRPGGGANHPPPSRTEVKERVKLYLNCPSGYSWPVLGWTLPLPSASPLSKPQTSQPLSHFFTVYFHRFIVRDICKVPLPEKTGNEMSDLKA